MGASAPLAKADILRLLGVLNAELATSDTRAELQLVGGAVMCLALGARDSTRDVDALFRPTAPLRAAAARVAAREGLAEHWLNDAVKGFLDARGAFDPFLELSHLSVFVAQPAYLLAMKCVALRIGEEFHDLDDVRYLLRYLNVTRTADALDIVTKYFDAADVPVKTRLALEEILGA
ncbi:MAG: hypothetical protein U9Q74_15880 [Gemmatimonadota bacterium]|nr:hypothetical protein [Gemmatimonadota bacterium]